MQKRDRNWWQPLAAFGLSLVFCIVFLEFALRLILDPVDLLKPDLEAHAVLGHVIVPSTGGHDAAGYRNVEVIEAPAIVTLGDSMTYGNVARMRESWPSQLSEITGSSVYNMGIGAYGPAEYAYLLEHDVLPMQPSVVVVGLYFGNDLHNAYVSVLRRPHWQDLRASTPGEWPDADAPPPNDMHRVEFSDDMGLRRWLRGRSMLMRSFEQSPLGQFVNAIGDVQPAGDGASCQLPLTEPMQTVIKLESRRPGIDLGTREVSIGLEVTSSLIRRMSAASRDAGIDIVFALIPGKERVLAPHAAPVPPECADLLLQLTESETRSSNRIKAVLESEDVPWIDLYPVLRDAASQEPIYIRSGDTHPNAAGYRIIAEEIAGRLASITAGENPNAGAPQ